MIIDKIELCVKDFEKDFFKVPKYSIKYLNKFGFASVYFKLVKGVNTMFVPLIVLPDKIDDKDDYALFLKFLEQTGLDKFFVKDGVYDKDSLYNILEFVEHERFKSSRKKARHLDLSEFGYIDSVKSVIDEYLILFSDENIKCVYNNETHNLVIVCVDNN